MRPPLYDMAPLSGIPYDDENVFAKIVVRRRSKLDPGLKAPGFKTST